MGGRVLVTRTDRIIARSEAKGKTEGLKALVRSLLEYITDFPKLYIAVRKNEEYANVSEEEVRRIYSEIPGFT